MKQNKALIVEFVVGVLFIGAGLGIRIDYYSTLLFAMGFGLAAGSARQIARILYWSQPKRRAAYEEKKWEAHINSVDERKRYLQMKAGQISAQVMALALLILDFVLAVLRVEVWITGMVFILFLFLYVTDAVAMRVLEKRM